MNSLVTPADLNITRQRRQRCCRACNQPGHDRRTCMLPSEVERRRIEQENRMQRIQQAREREVERQRQIREDEERIRKERVRFVEITNLNDYQVILFWARPCDPNKQEISETEECKFKFGLLIDPQSSVRFSTYKNSYYVSFHINSLPTELMTTAIDDGLTIYMTLKDYNYNDIIHFDDEQNLLNEDGNVKYIERYLEPKVFVKQKTEIEKWKECGIKAMFLLKELDRMGASNNPNLEPIMDLVQDIEMPDVSEIEKENAGVPSGFTNIT